MILDSLVAHLVPHGRVFYARHDRDGQSGQDGDQPHGQDDHFGLALAHARSQRPHDRHEPVNTDGHQSVRTHLEKLQR